MSANHNVNPKRPLRVLVSAGEASSEMYGAELIRALRELRGDGYAATDAVPAAGAGVEFFGLGGERMREAGCELVVEARNVAVVGLFEVLSHLPRIYRDFHRLLAEVDRRRPDVAVLIDFPDWNLRLARQLHRRGIPVVYYVSPQLWAWRTWRVKLVERYVSRMLVIFPFERDFYAQRGVQAEFVGHPLGELEPPEVSREEFARRWGLDAAKQWIALLPGSRRKELRMNLPAMLAAAARLGPEFDFVMPVASTLERGWVEAEVARCWAQGAKSKFQGFKVSEFQGEEQQQGQGQEQQQKQGQLPHPSQLQARMGHPEDFSPAGDSSPVGDFSPVGVGLTGDARASLLHARAAVVASGTATVEAALIGTPFVMVYRLGRLTWALGRRLVKLPHYGMVNLIAGRQVVPELIQEQFTPEAVECHLRVLLEEGPARQRMTEALAEVRGLLRGEVAAAGAAVSAAQRAAQAVLRVARAAEDEADRKRDARRTAKADER